jgi:NAD(P)-dependent dehydrogenase (short-subunit alcohol dehydrogenase family)
MSSVLAGRCAVITGATQGLGREIARAFLAAGADVALCARTTSDVEATAAALREEHPNRTVFASTCDIARADDVDRLFDCTIEKLGAFDILVNNAGIHGPISSLDAADWSKWCDAIGVNLIGTAYCCRRAVQHFKSHPVKDRRWKIINLSGGGATAPQPGMSAYAASKAGLVRLTETLAHEVRSFAIDVNAVAPGALRTRLMEELRSSGLERLDAEYHAKIEQIYSRGGMSITRAAELCVYLASADSDGITGRLISAPWDPWPFNAAAVEKIVASDIYTLRRVVPLERDQTSID